MDNKFSKIWEEIEKEKCITPDIKEYFGLPNSFDKYGVDYITGTDYQNYDDELKALLRVFISFIKKDDAGDADNKTKVVLIVGQAGIGKSTFISHFTAEVGKIISQKRFVDGKYKTPVGTLGFSAKLLTLDEFLNKLNKDEKRFGLLDDKEKQILFLEDLQELFLEENSKHDYRKEFFERIKKYNNCFIILTTTVTNWSNLIKLSPEIKYNFDEIINLNGLNNEYLLNIYNDRIKPNKFQIPESKVNYIINLVDRNPRLLFFFFNHLFDKVYKDRGINISDEDIEFVKSKLGFNLLLELEHLSKTELYLLNELTAMDKMYPTLIASKTALSRITVTQNLNRLENMGYIIKEKIRKNVFYNLKLAIRNKLERNILVNMDSKQNGGKLDY